MAQVSLFDSPLPDGHDLWLKNPIAVFDQWQRSTPHSEGGFYAAHSLRQHRAMWHRFIEYLNRHGLSLATVGADRIVGFLDNLLAKNGTSAQDSTRRRYLKLLASTFEHLAEIGLRTNGNPCASLMKIYRPPPTKSPVSLASQQEERFVDMVLAERAESWRDLRDQAMLVLIAGSGLYTSEVINLQMDDLILEAEPPYIHIPSHGKVPERKAPVIAFALEPLRKWLEIRDTLPLAAHETAVFISGKGGKMLPATLYRKVQAVLKAHGSSLRPRGGFGPQVLRNAFLVRQLEKAKPVAVVQQWAGHVETKSTLRFRSLVVNPGGVQAE
jgi:site-specific recombinase XerD